MKVFLGGTCNGSKWREALIPMLKFESYNPVVSNWTPECQEREIQERKDCDFCLYVITPAMTGFLSIAEVVDDSHKRPNRTLLVVLNEDTAISTETGDEIDLGWNKHQQKSLAAIMKMVERNGGRLFGSLEDVAKWLNEKV